MIQTLGDMYIYIGAGVFQTSGNATTWRKIDRDASKRAWRKTLILCCVCMCVSCLHSLVSDDLELRYGVLSKQAEEVLLSETQHLDIGDGHH